MRLLGSWLGSPLPALEFLTTLRLHRVPIRSADALARALWAFPLVGAVVGIALFGVERGTRELAPDAAVAALVLLAWIVLTGGLHLDGLADTADGLFGGRDRDGRLAIMRDSRAGSWAIIAVSAALITKFALVLALPIDGRFSALLLAPLLARAVVVPLMAAMPYARPEGFAKTLHASAAWAPALVALALGLAAAGILFDAEGLLIVVWTAMLGAGLACYARVRLGGLTGDVDGALIEILELATLLAAVVALGQGWLDPWLWDGG